MRREGGTVEGMNWWEETWEVGRAGTVEDAAGALVLTTEWRREHDNQDAVARLASAAPDMARVLLAIEEREAQCVSCDEGAYWDDTTDKLVKPHRPDCPLDAALRKAGVR